MKVGVVGATGYVGSELLRWLLAHPRVEVAAISSRSRAGARVDAVHPGLMGLAQGVFVDVQVEQLAALDAVFLATPHGAALELARALDAAGCPLIFDMSRDHRHAKGWVYGQPEWAGESLLGATRVAVPGCFATAIGLALAPLVHAAVVSGPVCVSAMTGSTGSGATASDTTHHPLRFGDVKAYKVLRHQHTPEIEGFLAGLGPRPAVRFVPHSGPIDRGIFATCFVPTSPSVDAPALFEEAYGSAPLVRLRPDSPRLRWVRGTGFCDIAVHRQEDTVVVLSAIDNLGRGAAAQGVQALNAVMGWPVATGLAQAPLTP